MYITKKCRNSSVRTAGVYDEQMDRQLREQRDIRNKRDHKCRIM